MIGQNMILGTKVNINSDGGLQKSQHVIFQFQNLLGMVEIYGAVMDTDMEILLDLAESMESQMRDVDFSTP